MADETKGNDETKKNDPWSWLTKTWLGQVFGLIALVTAPFAFLETRGFAWTFFIAAIAAWFYWFNSVLFAFEPQTPPEPKTRTYSNWGIVLRALVPATFSIGCLLLLVMDVNKLNIWRQDFPNTVLIPAHYGTTNKFFGDTAPRTTPEEKASFEGAEWIRWMESGAQKGQKNGELLFVETESFTKRYHTFALEIHDLGTQTRPSRSGAAFLIQDLGGDPWKRKRIRQVPCDFAGDGDSRLYRVIVENPEPGEYLWLFLSVNTTSANVNLSSLNLPLKVRK